MTGNKKKMIMKELNKLGVEYDKKSSEKDLQDLLDTTILNNEEENEKLITEAKEKLDDRAVVYNPESTLEELQMLVATQDEKDKLYDKLDSAGIDYDEEMTVEELEALLPADQPTDEEKGVVFKKVSTQQDFSKPHMLDGEFAQNGIKKYYLTSSMKMVRDGARMVFPDSGAECGYYLNLSPSQVEDMRKTGKIIPKLEEES